MRRGREEIDDEVLLLRLHPRHPLAAPPLRVVHLRRHALDVACVRDWDVDVLLGDVVLVLLFEGFGLDFLWALFSVLVFIFTRMGHVSFYVAFSSGMIDFGFSV